MSAAHRRNSLRALILIKSFTFVNSHATFEDALPAFNTNDHADGRTKYDEHVLPTARDSLVNSTMYAFRRSRSA